MIKFACISPHPPIILPDVGSAQDRQKVMNTAKSLNLLGTRLREITPDTVVISSPHPDWGFNVPLYFLISGLTPKLETFLTQSDSPEDHFGVGKDYYFAELRNLKETLAIVASGDLSHRLKKDGPYGLHSDGAKFDDALVAALKNKDIETILNLDNLYPEAGECGLRSICFMLGILEAANIKWNTNVLSYEAPFGVGYLVASLID